MLPHPERDMCFSIASRETVHDTQDKAEWKLQKLAGAMSLTQPALKACASFWVARGVITESRASRGEVIYRCTGQPDPPSPPPLAFSRECDFTFSQGWRLLHEGLQSMHAGYACRGSHGAYVACTASSCHHHRGCLSSFACTMQTT